MKKIMAALILLMTLCLFTGCGKKNEIILQADQVEMISFSKGQSVVDMFHGFIMKKVEDGTEFSFNTYISDEPLSIVVEKEVFEAAAKVLEENQVGSWNGFHKTNTNVMDGENFSLTVVLGDGQMISASGSNKFPENYNTVATLLWQLGMNAYSKLPKEELNEEDEKVSFFNKELKESIDPDTEFLENDFFTQNAVCDRDYLYFATNRHIYKIHKENDQVTELVALDSNITGEELFGTPTLLYAGKQLFWLRSLSDGKKEIYAVNKENGEWIRIEETKALTAVNYIGCYEGIFYIEGYIEADEFVNKHYAYQVADFGLGDEVTDSEKDCYKAFPEDLYIQNLGFDCSILPQMLHRGQNFVYTVYDEEGNCIVYFYDVADKIANVIEVIPSAAWIRYYDNESIIYVLPFYASEDEKEHTYCYHVQTGETTELASENVVLIGGNENSVYYLESDVEGATDSTGNLFVQSYQLTALDINGADEAKEEILPLITAEPGMRKSVFDQASNYIVSTEQSIYYIESDNYCANIKRMNRKTGDCKDIITIYQDNIGKVGSVSTIEQTSLCDECGKVDTMYYIEVLQVSDSMKEAQRMNEILEAEAKKRQDIMEQNMDYESDCYHEEMMGNGVNSFSIEVSVPFVNDRYMQVLYQGYDYYAGAAHGMPYQYGKLFDLQTGEEASLKDILAMSEDELNKRLWNHFVEYEAMGGEINLDLIEDSVGRFETMPSECGAWYFSEEGLNWYYGSYEVASFAGGMPQVVLPWEAITLKE